MSSEARIGSGAILMRREIVPILSTCMVYPKGLASSL
jgi:hypothetical protein